MTTTNDTPTGDGKPSYIDIPPAHDLHAQNHRDDLFPSKSPIIDGLDTIQTAPLTTDGLSPGSDLTGSLLRYDIPGIPTPEDIAFAAMQYLPTPLLVLGSMKTVVMANEAMSRLLGFDQSDNVMANDVTQSPLEGLKGKTLTEVGIDMLQDGRYVSQVSLWLPKIEVSPIRRYSTNISMLMQRFKACAFSDLFCCVYGIFLFLLPYLIVDFYMC